MTLEDRAAEIVAGVREALGRGESVDAERLVGEHPEIAEPLRRQLAAVLRLRRAFGPDAAKPPELVGRNVGPWRLVAALGTGGMGTVYRAERGAEVVALKVIHPHLLAHERFLERFRREAEIGLRLRHDNVVRTLDADSGDVDGRRVHFLVMEFVLGRTLRALLGDMERLPEELCRHVGREVARGLAAIHAAGAVHRDLKPDNVIVTPDDAVKVMDLGVARLRDEATRLSQTGAFVGSVRYGAPEQFAEGEAVDGRADLYALGLTLYEAATGRHPFGGDDVRSVVRRQMTEVPRPAGEIHPQISPLFEELLAQLLEKDRHLRPSSADDVARILEEGEESAWWRARAALIRARTRRPLRRIRIARETALYGRDAEMVKLAARFASAKAGDGQVVLIEGEAGIGKSRLVDEYVALLHREGEDVNFLSGSYPPGGAATPSGAFSFAYRAHLGEDEAAVREALPQAPRLAPAFAALLRGDAAPEGADLLTKDSLQTVFVHATRSFAATRPTIVFIDDLHFAPAEGRALFAALALAVPGHRVLLVGAARPGEPPNRPQDGSVLPGSMEKWLGEIERLPHASRMTLPRLSAKDLVFLLRDSLRSELLAEELVGRIAVKSDGNPFFVFEILRGLREGQFLTRRPDGTWATTRLIAEIEVPSSVVDLVQARVCDLSRSDRNVLEVASCVGFEFDPALVGDVLAMPRIALLQTLGAIEKSHRLVRSAGRRFVFDHHQVMEVLHGGLSDPLREEYHAAIGTAIEARCGAASKEPADLDGALAVSLAEHLLAGSQGARALRYLGAALTHLESNYLNEAAVRLADRALATPGLLTGRARCELLLRICRRLDFLGRRGAERAVIDEALALADADGDATLRSRARRSLARHLRTTGRYDDATALLREARGIAQAAGDRKSETGIVAELGGVLWAVGRFDEALEFHREQLAFASQAGDKRAEGAATGNVGIVLLLLGRIAESKEHFERALVLSRETGDRRTERVVTSNLGHVLRELGRFAEAREHSRRNLALARETGDRIGESSAVANLARDAADLGRFAEAVEHYRRSLALARETGDRQDEAIFAVNLIEFLLPLGRLDEARETSERALELVRHVGNPRIETYALDAAGEVAAAEGRDAAAETAWRAAAALRERTRYVTPVAESRSTFGSFLARTGRTEEARSLFEAARGSARQAGLPGAELVALAHLATLPGGEAAAAEEALARDGPRLGAGQSMDVRFALFRATGRREHLDEAKRLLDEMLEANPEDARAAMLANVRLNREIAAAASQFASA